MEMNTKEKNEIEMGNEMINTLQYNAALFTFIEIRRPCHPCKAWRIGIGRSIKRGTVDVYMYSYDSNKHFIFLFMND